MRWWRWSLPTYSIQVRKLSTFPVRMRSTVMCTMSKIRIQKISTGEASATSGRPSAQSPYTAMQASTNPMTVLPASPRKIRARPFDLRLNGRNPRQLPSTARANHPRKGWRV